MAKYIKSKRGIKLKNWVIIPDLHYPYHDPKFIKVISKVISLVKPSGGIVQLGDAIDFFQLSKFDKDPARKNTARDDLELYREQMLRWANLLPDGSCFRQLEGNHEHRLTRFIWGRSGEIAQMVQAVPEMLGIKELNKISRIRYEWFPINNYRSCVIGDCLLHHGTFFNKHVAVTNLERYPNKFICGHTHRIQLAYNGDKWSCTLGHGSLEDDTSHIPAPTGWSQAFAILTETRGECSIEVISVKDGKCIFRGESL